MTKNNFWRGEAAAYVIMHIVKLIGIKMVFVGFFEGEGGRSQIWGRGKPPHGYVFPVTQSEAIRYKVTLSCGFTAT